MMSKKLHKGLSKFITATILACSVSGIAYAADGDIYNLTDLSKPAYTQSQTKSFKTQKSITLNSQNFGYELSGKVYKFDDLSELFTKYGQDITKAKASLLTEKAAVGSAGQPINISDIQSVNDINVLDVAVGTLPTLPTTVNVILTDGTTKEVAITWNALATANATYATAGTVTVNGTLASYGNYAVRASVIVKEVQIPVITSGINLGMAGNYAILAKSGISSVPTYFITGDIGVSPSGATYITGFAQTMDSSNVFSTSTQVNGKIYAPGYALTTPGNLTTAVSNMETAYTDAAGRAANDTELYTGDIRAQL